MKKNNISQFAFSFFRIQQFAVLFLTLTVLANTGMSQSEVIKPHKTNFFIFEKGGEVFYPIGANAGLFMNPEFPEKGIDSVLKTWSDAGINTIRFCLDDYHKPTDLKEFENPDGSLKDGVLSRVDVILKAAQKHNMWAILCFFDIESIAHNWKNHPFNKKNGGGCENIADIFLPEMIGKNTKRIQQVMHNFSGCNILAWEIARGVNIWEIPIKTGDDAARQGEFWVFRMADTLSRVNQEGRMTALSYVPNTLPVTLMGVDYININLLTLESNNPVVAAQSTAKIIDIGRTQYKKPVFIADIIWKGKDDQRAELTRDVFWSSVVSGSGSFISPNPLQENSAISGDSLNLVKAAKLFLSYLDLEGSPRPPSKVPIELQPIESCVLIEGMQGKDWMFWLLRKETGDTTPKIIFKTVEGLYDYHWFYTDNTSQAPTKEFVSARKEIKMQVPNFEHDMAGVLRLKRRMEDKNNKSKVQINQPTEEMKISLPKQ